MGLLLVGCLGEGPLGEEAVPHADSLVQKPEESVLQTPEEAAIEDNSLVAEARGWTVAEATKHRASAEAAGRIASKVVAKGRELFVGSLVDDEPGQPAIVYVKGRIDRDMREWLAEEEGAVRIIDKQPYSFDETVQRQTRLTNALKEAGYGEIAVSSEIQRRGHLKAKARRKSGQTAKGAATPVNLPLDIAGTTTIEELEESFMVEQQSIGGLFLKQGLTLACTSSWTVRSRTNPSVTGITTAAHCNNLTGIRHANDDDYGITLMASVYNWVGDMEWYTTLSTEPAQFHANSSSIRSTRSVKAGTALVIGESICVYSRMKNVRNCSARLANFPYEVTNPNGVTHSIMARMNKEVTVGGDSGAGWSYTNTAYGIHKGVSDEGSTFTIAEYVGDLQVDILTQP